MAENPRGATIVTELLSVDQAIAMLEGGRVVALPTDTVYGVAASLGDVAAVAELFALKHRPASTALPILIDSLRQISRLGVTWPQDARRLAEAFWPGPLTIVVRVPHELAARVGSVTDTAGFRIPDDGVLRNVLDRCGPLALTSANEHGERPCTTADEVIEALGDRPELGGVLDDGERSGVVSTVVDLSERGWRLVREGSIGHGVIAGILGPSVTA